MGDIFRQLGELFVQTIPTVGFVFLLFAILDRVFFRPLGAVLKKREDATQGALERARADAATAEAKAREYEEAFQAARQELYRQREADHRSALAEREAALQKARQHAEALLREAQAKLAGEVAMVKADLETACRSLAQQISHTLVASDSPNDKAGGVRS